MKKHPMITALVFVLLNMTSCTMVQMVKDQGSQTSELRAEDRRQAALVARGPYPVATGPAGGLVFYDKGTFSDGWRYLEAAPVEHEFTAVWSAGKKVVNTSKDFGRGDFGTGKKNTQQIIAVVASAKETETAAQKCAALNINGFNDWHLPSFREAEAMLVNLHWQSKGDFAKPKDTRSAMYLTSSQIDDETVWYVDFAKGQILWGDKNLTYRVRPIRAY
jgi:hypothetical protein